MDRLLNITFRLAFSLGLLVLAASCSSQLAATPVAPAPTSAPIGPSPTDTPPTAVQSPSPSVTPTSLPATLPVSSPSVTPTSLPNDTPSATLAPPIASATPSVPTLIIVTITDNGKTITMQPKQRFLLQLGPAYDWKTTIDDPAVLSLVPNSVGQDNQGVYEAEQAGQANLSAVGTPQCYKSTPRCLIPSLSFSLHVKVVAQVPPAPTAGTVPPITLDEDGGTITLHVGDRVLLDLGTGFNWEEPTVGNPAVLALVPGVMVIRGAQGLYQAKSPGTTTLSDNGRIPCPPNQICPMVIRNFAVHVVVR